MFRHCLGAAGALAIVGVLMTAPQARAWPVGVHVGYGGVGVHVGYGGVGVRVGGYYPYYRSYYPSYYNPAYSLVRPYYPYRSYYSDYYYGYNPWLSGIYAQYPSSLPHGPSYNYYHRPDP